MTWINSTVAAYLVKKHLELETVPSEWGPGAGAAGQPRSWMYYVGGVIIVGSPRGSHFATNRARHLYRSDQGRIIRKSHLGYGNSGKLMSVGYYTS
ncbi:hypothetical protein HYE67_005227 [Fusarium culmorum]|uniref:Uncharacterized protein n=1 Tax=Fusarium culmorum TaxID=5516 RepID=A0A7S8HVC1_FUSCU|nr:hypothetical protein HYE67_005227 [Fusarium culmorum]